MEGLLRHGLAVTGIDVSPVIVDEAVARNPGLHGLSADLRQLPFASEQFDAVFSGSTLDHLESSADIAAALAELGRVLKPGGRLILTMDKPENPLIRLRNGPLLGLLLRLGIVPYQVGVTLARAPLLKALRRAGFNVLTTRALMHCPRVVAVALAQPIRHSPFGASGPSCGIWRAGNCWPGCRAAGRQPTKSLCWLKSPNPFTTLGRRHETRFTQGLCE